MTTDIIEDVQVSDPFREPLALEKPDVEQDLYGLLARWQTPGLYIGENIKANPEVRFVGEKLQPEYLQTIIVLDSDPEEHPTDGYGMVYQKSSRYYDTRPFQKYSS